MATHCFEEPVFSGRDGMLLDRWRLADVEQPHPNLTNAIFLPAFGKYQHEALLATLREVGTKTTHPPGIMYGVTRHETTCNVVLDGLVWTLTEHEVEASTASSTFVNIGGGFSRNALLAAVYPYMYDRTTYYTLSINTLDHSVLLLHSVERSPHMYVGSDYCSEARWPSLKTLLRYLWDNRAVIRVIPTHRGAAVEGWLREMDSYKFAFKFKAAKCDVFDALCDDTQHRSPKHRDKRVYDGSDWQNKGPTNRGAPSGLFNRMFDNL